MSNPEIMWPKAFAWSATNKNAIQEERQPSQDVQDATLSDGFPIITMTPQDAGGIAPNGQDMNGALYAISSNMVHRQKGIRIQFDPDYAAKIGGYDQGCILASNDYTCDYISLIPNNLTDPNGSGTAGKWAIYSGAGSVASATASVAGIVKIIDNLSSMAADAALTAKQGKVLQDTKISRTLVTTPINADMENTTGVRVINVLGNTNLPFDVFGALNVYSNENFAIGALRVYQTFQPDVFNDLFFRKRNGGVWSAWERVLKSSEAFGVDQTWQNVLGSRFAGVTYTNTTPKTITVFISILHTGDGNFYVNGQVFCNYRQGSLERTIICLPIPPNSNYMIQQPPETWLEMR